MGNLTRDLTIREPRVCLYAKLKADSFRLAPNNGQSYFQAPCGYPSSANDPRKYFLQLEDEFGGRAWCEILKGKLALNFLKGKHSLDKRPELHNLKERKKHPFVNKESKNNRDGSDWV
ncbi:hypothetical protein J6590_104569 [Homalodisca vitripennis]|nr:hypothetical protein J6590_061543 [Homalodisca vitripennis]KAG8328674.1 hypothetical protein J6590_104569 [Homalodisca vitripennis]